MRRREAQMPDYFPVGTTYVVEGKNNAKGVLRVSARYVVLPGGRRVDLPLVTVSAPPLSPRHAIGKRKRRAGRRHAARVRRETALVPA